MFTHSHVVNGVTIVHSHPYHKDQQHSHSSIEFELLQILNHIVSTGSNLHVFTLVFIPIFSLLLIAKPIYEISQSPYFGFASLRAPPAFLLSLKSLIA